MNYQIKKAQEKMSIEIEDTSYNYVIHLNGDFDAILAEKSRVEFGKLADVAEKNVVLNLSNVDFIDSSGVGAIVFLYKRLRCKKLELSLSHPKQQPKELIKLLRIHKIIDVQGMDDDD